MNAIEPVAIIGIGCRMPGGVKGRDDLWNLLVGGVDAVTEIPKGRWNLSATYHPDPARPGRTYSRWGGFLDHIDRFDAQFFGISPREAASADPQQRILLEVAYEAVEDAGLTLPALVGKRVGVYVGMSSFDYSFQQVHDRASIDGYTALGLSLCIAANRISYFFNLTGPSLAVDTACSSSLVATHLGCRSIWDGESEMAFVGGVSLILRPDPTIAFSKASMLSPDGRCKSFDARANGYVRGEGAGIVVLKPLARAVADGDRIYAVIRATAVNQDGRTEGITVPNQAAQEVNLRNALRFAEITPESVQYVEAHGTGTPVGDPIEAAALGSVYGKVRNGATQCVIGSIKSNLGHLESAAGITGLIKAALCLHHGQIPASLHFENPNPQIAFEELCLRVVQRLESWPPTYGHARRAGVNSFGFGGTNAHAILEAAPAGAAHTQPAAESENARAYLLPLSARSSPALSDLVRSYSAALADERGLQRELLRDICFSAGAKRSHHEFRLALVAHDKPELTEQLAAFLRGEARPHTMAGRVITAPSRPALICSGMGQQWWAMGRELLAEEPVFRRTIEEVSELYSPLAGWSLFHKLTADETSSQIRRTDVGQPAIFAVQVALAAVWRSWGIEPAAILGHSSGEVAAAYICGALSLKHAVAVAFHRSRLQQLTAGQGTMLAAGISREQAARFVESHATISVAAINGPHSLTLSGDAGVLAEIHGTLSQAALFSRPLQVEVPFHSPKMEQLESELIESLRYIRPRPASIPLFSTVSGTQLVGTELDAQYWYRNIRQPVLFHETMGKLIDAGHRLFLEIGAHPVLRSDIQSCLEERSVQGATVTSLRRGDRDRAAMLGSLGHMYTLGAEIDWGKLFPTGASAIKLPSYPFQAEIHWRESESSRQERTGNSVHPLLGAPLAVSKPFWKGELDARDLSYLADHQIRGSTVFPAAGFVEMALAAAQQLFGPIPCILENIEFQKFLVLSRDAASSTEVAIDTESNEFLIHVCAGPPGSAWELHACGRLRQAAASAQQGFDRAQIRQRCADPIDRTEFYRRFSEIKLEYGDTFRGVACLWRGDREALAEISVPTELRTQLHEYRFHPAVLDACLHSAFAAVPMQSKSPGARAILHVPVMIERLSFHAKPSNRLFAYAQLKELGRAEVKADIQVIDAAGNRIVDVEGLILRPSGLAAPRLSGNQYELQWKLHPRATSHKGRDSRHLPSLETLGPLMEQQGEVLRQRFNRSRYDSESKPLSRSIAAAYITRALRQLGWSPTADASIKSFADRLHLSPQYRSWLKLISKELTAAEIASINDPHLLWRIAWDEFPENHVETMLLRKCGENLASVLRGELDPLSLIFPDGALTTAEILYQDSSTFRLNNLLVQEAIVEVTRRLPRGRALRILEIGGGTGGMTSFVLPVLPMHCTEYVFTDVSSRFTAHAQHKFVRYPFVQYRTLDIECDPIEQGFDQRSFDVIIASDVLHATRDLRNTVERVKRLLGSCGTLVLLEMTRPWLASHVIFGLLRGWWLFEDHDLRPDHPLLSAQSWKRVLDKAGFSSIICVADGPDPETAQHSVILARGPQISIAPSPVPQAICEPKTWLVIADNGAHDRSSRGSQLARELRARGDRVIEVRHGDRFQRLDESFQIGAANADDMRRLIDAVSGQARRLAGIVHLSSLDAQTSDVMTSDMLVLAAKSSWLDVLQLVRAIAATDGFVVEALWLVTRGAQWLDAHHHPPQVMQSPVWGLGRVAMNEYPDLRCRLVDLTTCSHEEIASLADELRSGQGTELELALNGELRYVRRLVPVSPATVNGLGRQPGLAPASQPFRIEVQRPGILDSVSVRPMTPQPLKPGEVEIEVVASGINFKDLMLAMGLLPGDAIADFSSGILLGLECAGRISAVGDKVSHLVVGDEVVAFALRSLASRLIVDARLVARKPHHLSFEQAATIPAVFLTAFYGLNTLGRLQTGERVLIHSASGGVGLAAVQLALKAGAIVFATAGSPQKRALLRMLGVPHVMDSRSLSFADEVLKLTAGEGVDLVLNSLAGEAIEKSLSLLRPHGRFIEIGRSDIYKNRKLGMRPLGRNISVFCVNWSSAVDHRPDLVSSLLPELLDRFARKELHPLPHRPFPVTRVAEALQYMAQAKHVGKLVIAIKDTQGVQLDCDPPSVTVSADGSYLISGGLGGFGLAVADHLARLGARHLALVGRKDPPPSAQRTVDSLRHRGVEVMVCRADIADPEQASRVVSDVQRMGPLRGVVHAAMVLDDAPIERLDEARMWKAMAPKVLGAWNLHTLTANTALDFFVLFSSFASIIGTPGQANYAAGNAFLDELAYYRRASGLPALTVNWGVLGDVGHVAKNQEASQKLARAGLTAMPVAQAFETLDELMSSNAVQVAVSVVDWKVLSRSLPFLGRARISTLVGEAGSEEPATKGDARRHEIFEAAPEALPSLLRTYIRDHLAQAMGASPAGVDVEQSLLNLGLDSLIAVEARNRINADLGINVPLDKFMQGASIATLASYVAERMLERTRGQRVADDRSVPRETSSLVPLQPLGTRTPLFCVYPIAGTAYLYKALADRLGPDQPVYGLQTNRDNARTLETIEEMASGYVKTAKAVQPTGPYLLAGWSLGGQIAFEMAHQLTDRGEKVALLVLFDSVLPEAEYESDPERWADTWRAAEKVYGDVEQVVRSSLLAWTGHKPSPYSGDVLLFQATDTDFLSGHRNRDSWRRLVTNGLAIESVPGNHFTLMQEPNIGPVTERLATSLDQALQRGRQFA
jgi:acyl transferase domain-containing protein/thioesterase domain-containing protein/ubiquinone/menaquinone biosynthesis C-methylase UbiE/acyl carrier protein